MITKENTPQIETERLILRKFTESDAQDVLLLYGDVEANRFLPWFPLQTLAEAEDYLQKTIFPCYQKEIAYSYAITLKSDHRAIGYLHIHDIGGSNDIGYGLCRELWHRGIITEACAGVVDRLRAVGFSFLTATHDINNPHSGAVMKKIGMSYRYSYEEQWQPKDILVTFRMYQLSFDSKNENTYMEYWNRHKNHFVEPNV